MPKFSEYPYIQITSDGKELEKCCSILDIPMFTQAGYYHEFSREEARKIMAEWNKFEVVA